MNRRTTYFGISLLLTLGTLILLATGSSLLTLSIDNENTVPLGTLITWAGMISFPLSIYWGIRELRKPTTPLFKILARFHKFIILLGILWVPLSFMLSGNLSFSFSETNSFQGGQTAMKWFWRLSYGIGVGGLLTIFTYWVSLLCIRIKASD